MSWFEPSNWNSIGSIAKTAKTALKHAQKNIDKVLDIPDIHVENSSTENASVQLKCAPGNPEIKEETEGFFSLFGVTNNDNPSKTSSTSSLNEDSNSQTKSLQQLSTRSRKSSSSSLSRLRSADTWSSSELHAFASVDHPVSEPSVVIPENQTLICSNDGNDIADGMVVEHISLDPPLSSARLSRSSRETDGLTLGLDDSHGLSPFSVSSGRLEILFHDENSMEELRNPDEVAESLVNIPLDESIIDLIPVENLSERFAESSSDEHVIIEDEGKSNEMIVETILENGISDQPSDGTDFQAVEIIPLTYSENATSVELIENLESALSDGEDQCSVRIETTTSVEDVPEWPAPEMDDVVVLKYEKELESLRSVVAAREQKLLEVNRETAELKEANDNLTNQICELRNVQPEGEQLRKEFGDRISQLERKLQLAGEEKKSLSEQLQLTKTELSNSLRSKTETSGVQFKEVLRQVEEKDMQIKELLEEGEKLSKQQFQSSSHIKKLRSKQTELEAENGKLKTEVEEKSNEITALKATITLSDELQEKNVVTIKQLTATVDKLEKDIISTRNLHEESKSKISSMQAALDTAYRELADLHRQRAAQEGQVHETLLSTEIAAKEELRLALEQQKQQLIRDHEELVERAEVLQSSLSRAEAMLKRKEEAFREEIGDYQQRLQEAVLRNEELGQNLAQATRPLLRQNEALQKQLLEQATTFDKLEQTLTKRLQDAVSQLAVGQEKERAATDRFTSLAGKVQALETQINIVREERQCLSMEADLERKRSREFEEKVNSLSHELERTKDSSSLELVSLKKEKQYLEHQMALQKENLDMERRKVVTLTEQISDLQRQLRLPSTTLTSNSEPGVLRRSESVSSTNSAATLEGRWSPSSSTHPANSLYDVIRGGGATPFLMNVESQVKMKEDEIRHLKLEMKQLDFARQKLEDDLLKSTEKSLEMDKLKEEVEMLKTSKEDVVRRHNAMLQMYGEKVEELEELRLDYEDMKSLYKSQIDALTRGQS